MNAIAKISDNIKSLLCASSQIINFPTAVQELVFNCIDAEATSIAVRIHIGEGNIQVIDNGCGINKNDFEVLGQNYMTSKLVDITTLKSMPVKYGFRGQSLANIVQVSKCVKVTSRSELSEETFTKIFEFGKEKQIVKAKTRPSKGTTVEIKGFLYNLPIQKKCSNFLIELQDIKSFLENTSLVHYNLSMSLRDDSTNDIVFKIHKNRDIYQTLLNLFGIEETDVQKLQVEKNEYKVIAYIAIRDDASPKQLIFLNGMLLPSDSRFHKAVNCKLSKQIKSKKAGKQKKCYDNQEDYLKCNTPFYVIFFKCPYFDYSLKMMSKNTIIDFKDWTEINRLFEKLVKFYNGDNINDIKEIKYAKSNIEEVNKFIYKNKNINTKEKVKQIINKIFGSKPKASLDSQMHNGVKGKQIKRNHKKKTQAKLSIPKMVDSKINIENSLTPASFDAFPKIRNAKIKFTNVEKHNKIAGAGNKSKVKKSTKNTITPKIDTARMIGSKSHVGLENEKANNKISEITKNNRITENKHNEKLQEKIALHCKFNTPTDSIKQRYKILSKEANKLKNKVIGIKRQPKPDMIVKETIKHCNVIENNKNISIRQTMNEVITYESFPMPPHKLNIDADHHRIINEKNSLLSTYDILKTILTQQNNQAEPKNIPNATELETRNIGHDFHLERANHFGDTPIVTFKSHNYKNKNVGFDYVSRNNYYSKHNKNIRNVCRKSNAFITKKSMDNFVSIRGTTTFFLKNKPLRSNYKKNVLLKNTLKKTFDKRNLFYLQNNIFNNKEQSSYTIQFSESNDCNFNKYLNDFNAFDLKSNRNNTEESRPAYTLNHTPCMINLSDNPGPSNCLFQSSDILQTANDVVQNTTVNAYMNEEICTTYEQLKNHETYTIDESIYKSYTDSIKIHHDDLESYEQSFNHITYTVEPQRNTLPENQNINISERNTKVSDDIGPNSQKFNKLITDPIEVCETILESHETLRNEFETSFSKKTDSLHKVSEENNAEVEPNKPEIAININQDYCDLDLEQEMQTSHHFRASNITDGNENNKGLINGEHNVIMAFEKLYNNDENCAEYGYSSAINDVIINFNLQDRLGFLPKGMSQIFQNSYLKITCDSNSIQDYYSDNLYDEFAHKVQNTVEIFQPNIQEASDLVTKDINKVNTKYKKDNACLKFDGQSLKNSQVLGQVDEKFIAVIVKCKANDSEFLSEFLVLFDQHAVHERIRLETNLRDYFTGTEWNTVNIDEVTLKMSSDDIKFLHNYREKISLFGLQWSILSNNEVSVNAIPEAILGKNPRPADKIIKAVQSLIKEVINNVKLQRGCVPLYPKSIMDLVFSEACRYAIKFNDRLSKTDCIELIQKLSDCKTPFQCAHGRPVMAVIMDNKPIVSNYKVVSLNEVREFKKKLAPLCRK